MRAVLKRLELSAIAFGSSSRPTSWNVRFWRDGRSKTSAMPVSAAIAYTSHGCTCPSSVIAASTAEKTICTDWVTITVRRLSKRSVTTPANRPSSVNGPKRQIARSADGEPARVRCELHDQPGERDVLHPRAARPRSAGRRRRGGSCGGAAGCANVRADASLSSVIASSPPAAARERPDRRLDRRALVGGQALRAARRARRSALLAHRPEHACRPRR